MIQDYQLIEYSVCSPFWQIAEKQFRIKLMNQAPETLRGVVERITYHNEENGYTVARLAPERGTPGLDMASFGAAFGAPREVTIVGNLPALNVGEWVELRGRWGVHSDYGKQFIVEQMHAALPATVAGMEKYLGSGLIRGVGPVTAKRIVERFGAETLDVIEQTPERLLEVPKIGRKRVQMILAAWAEQRAIKEVMVFLQGHGVSTGLATKIYKAYGDGALDVVQHDPYRLARDIYGIGFLTADKLARSLGLPPDALPRIAAGVSYALSQASDEGHVYLPASELVQQAAALLGVAEEQVPPGIEQLQAAQLIAVAASGASFGPARVAETPAPFGPPDTDAAVAGAGGPAVYLAPFYYSEQGVANRVRRLIDAPESRLAWFQNPRFDWAAAIAAQEQRHGFALAPPQRDAVRAALTHRLTILTGGPGTGKTTTVRTVLDICRAAGRRVLLAAPTGRAAKRLAETTGQEARTLHRLLEFKPTEGLSFQRNEQNPLEGDLLIVDEASMLDLVLTNHLLKAVPPGMHLLLVGDVDQLPSVGAGSVLKDLIGALDRGLAAPGRAPGRATVVRLDSIFRQEAGSYIITNAHRINAGEMPVLDNRHAGDFFLFKVETPERAAQLCVELVQQRIPRRFAIPTQDIQVLSPMHRGVVGVAALNAALQDALNPPHSARPQRAVGSRAFRQGDRVMQVRNNYDKEVFNGDMGVIQAIDLELQKATVAFDGRPVAYDFLELDELTHAWAVSVHKSQGSEYPAVVIPLLTSHYMMLQRNLLYTAVTRARRLVVLVGQPKAIWLAVRNNDVTLRYTGLAERLLAAEALH